MTSSWRLTDREIEIIADCLSYSQDSLVNGQYEEEKIAEVKALCKRFQSAVKTKHPEKTSKTSKK